MRRLAAILLLVLGCAGTVRAVEAWRDADCSYRRKITIDNTNVDAVLSNFTMLVKLADSHQVDKDKIASKSYTFYDSSGNKLDPEEEAYSEGANYVNLVTWVETQSIASGSTTDIWIYYSHSDGDEDAGTGAWDADGNWKGVWHLKDLTDSSGAGLTLTAVGTATTTSSGKIDGAYDFPDWTADCLYVTTDNFRTASATWSCWFKRDADPASNEYVMTYENGATNRFMARAKDGDLEFYDDIADEGQTVAIEGSAFGTGTWYHLAVIFNADGTKEAYVDGAHDATTDSDGSNLAAIGSGASFIVASYLTAAGHGIDGQEDEFRVSDTVRTAAWIKFGHANVNEADNEITVAAEESKPAAGAPWFFLHSQRMRR